MRVLHELAADGAVELGNVARMHHGREANRVERQAKGKTITKHESRIVGFSTTDGCEASESQKDVENRDMKENIRSHRRESHSRRSHVSFPFPTHSLRKAESRITNGVNRRGRPKRCPGSIPLLQAIDPPRWLKMLFSPRTS